MWAYYKSQTATIPSEFDTLVNASHETYSVVTWNNDGNVYELRDFWNTYPRDQDADYYYEAYSVPGSNMITCLRATKHPTFNGDDIRIHRTINSDFFFDGNIKNPEHYADAMKACTAFYWHGYGDGTVDLGWCIENDLPFKFEFAVRPTEFDDYPIALWHKVENELPYKNMFPTRYAIDDAPSALWKISDDLPFKSSFAPRYSIDDAPMALWIKQPDGLPYKIVFPKMPKAPVMEKVYEGERQTIIVPNYHQTVILSAYRQQVIVEDYEL